MSAALRMVARRDMTCRLVTCAMTYHALSDSQFASVVARLTGDRAAEVVRREIPLLCSRLRDGGRVAVVL